MSKLILSWFGHFLGILGVRCETHETTRYFSTFLIPNNRKQKNKKKKKTAICSWLLGFSFLCWLPFWPSLFSCFSFSVSVFLFFSFLHPAGLSFRLPWGCWPGLLFSFFLLPPRFCFFTGATSASWSTTTTKTKKNKKENKNKNKKKGMKDAQVTHRLPAP